MRSIDGEAPPWLQRWQFVQRRDDAPEIRARRTQCRLVLQPLLYAGALVGRQHPVEIG
jgi:hypothetical protein